MHRKKEIQKRRITGFIFSIFFLAFVFYLFNSNLFTLTENTKEKPQILFNALSSPESDFSIVEDNKIIMEKLYLLDYNKLNSELNLDLDWGVYFEDSKNILKIKGVQCIGSPNILINGKSCKEKIS